MTDLNVSLTEQIERIFELQQKNRLFMANTSLKERKQRLQKIEHWVLTHQQEIRQALYNDFKKPEEETDLNEIFITLNELRHTLRHLRKWLKPKKVNPTLALLTTSAWVRLEARGLILIISPWNYPFHLTVVPLISAIAAGNCVIVKPSEFVPHTANLLKQMIEELFPPQEVAIFLGDATVAQALLKKPFDHIFFTGSTKVGKLVMQAAAEHLTSLTLELGGKSPLVIDQSANLKDAALKVAFGKYLNSGQTCVAPDYVLVHRQVQDEFEHLLKKELGRMFGQNEDEQKKAPYARIINQQHFQRLVHLLKEAETHSARVLFGGQVDSQQNFIAPTLIRLADTNGFLMKEEIFGPLLPIISFESANEAVAFINKIEPPLALYIFSKNKAFINTLTSQTRSGGVCINDVHLQYIHTNLPFGGLRESGIGNAHGFYSFKAFSHERAFVKQGVFSPLTWLFPPYNRFKHKLIQWAIKYFT